MIKNVIFDFGGVLIDWDPHRVYDTYFSSPEEKEYFLQHICSRDWNTEQDRGRTYAEGTRLLKEAHPEYAEPIDLFFSRWSEMLGGPIEPTVAWLKTLKNRGFGIYGLSNWSAETFPIARDRYDFFSLFDGMVVSGYVGLVKPDAAIYRLLLGRYQLQPAECVFLDDYLPNVEAARELGMKALHFTDAHEAAKAFEELL